MFDFCPIIVYTYVILIANYFERGNFYMPDYNRLVKREQIEKEREQYICKRTDMIQKARYTLKPQEQKTILYAISKIKPDDPIDKEYSIDIKDFFKVCGLTSDKNYSHFKKLIKDLSDKSWWYSENDTERLIRWFDTLNINKKSGIIKLRFHREMMPFLINLVKENQYITRYELKYILPMNCMYSVRLYELLKSYVNRDSWFFNIEDLKRLLDCQNYKNYKDFNNRALKPAIEEINKYSDIVVRSSEVRKGRKVERIVFYIDRKTTLEKVETWDNIREELDGQIYMDELIGYEDIKDANQFHSERFKAHDEQREFDKKRKEKFNIE